PAPLEPSMPVKWKTRHVPRTSTALLIGLVVLVSAGGILGSLSLLAHFGVLGAHSGPTAPTVVRGGTWTDDIIQAVGPLIPNEGAPQLDQALYLPLFYG